MKKPKMILFDYGQTLANETVFNSVKGNEALLRYADENPDHHTAQEISDAAKKLDAELGRFDPACPEKYRIEIPNYNFVSYLYESMGITLRLSAKKLDGIFWDAAAPGVATEGLVEFLSYLKENGIRTGVITNISYCGAAVEQRIRSLLPDHDFEFILSTCDYMFRKPDRRIFELALKKAMLQAEDVWYVGDKYDCDVVGAREAGIFPVWYIGALRSKLPARDVLTVSAWNELKQFIEHI